MGLSGWLERRFRLRELETDVLTEVRAGTTTFLTCAYILLVNAKVMGEPLTGIAGTDVVLGTAAASAVGCFLVGWFANLPFAMAPGLGLSAFLSYGMVLGSDLPWEGSLTCAFASGAVLLLLGLTDLADLCVRMIPKTIKVATVIGMGLLVTFIALQSVKLVVASGDESIVKMGELNHFGVWVTTAGLLLLATLAHHRVTGGVAIGISLTTLVVWAYLDAWPTQLTMAPVQSHALWADATRFDLIGADFGAYASGLGAFLLVGIFDVGGVIFGLAVLAGLDEEDKFGNIVVPNSKWVFVVSGLSTMVAAAMGCSPIIVQLESAAGIKDGGRSGLTAIVVGCWFTLSLFFAPLFGSIPQEATAPVILLIGASMMGQAKEVQWDEMRHAVPAFLTLVMMPFTFSIPNGIFFGLFANAVLAITCSDRIKLPGAAPYEEFHDTHHHAHGGAPIVNAQASSYGAVASADSAAAPRMVHQLSSADQDYMRSPMLILRSGEYPLKH